MFVNDTDTERKKRRNIEVFHSFFTPKLATVIRDKIGPKQDLAVSSGSSLWV